MSARKARAPRRKSRKPADDGTVSPAFRMGIILEHYRHHAHAVSSNPLTFSKTPQEALTACRELVESLYRDAFDRDGRQHVYSMLHYGLRDIERQLEPLFDCARQVAEGGAS